MANTNIDILDLQGLGTYDTKIKTEIGKKADDFVPIEYSEWLELADAQKDEHNWKLLHVPDSGPEPPDVPDGKTVTPTDDVATWLECAGIDPTGFSTLSDVLADSVTLQALIADSNAVDYLVRSTTFAKQITVPIMTSNNTPSGEVIYSDSPSSKPAYYAFDNDQNTVNQQSSDTTDPYYVGYDFGTPVKVNRVQITNFYFSYSGAGTRATAGDIVIQGSNDNSVWTDLSNVETFSSDGTSNQPYTADKTLNNTNLYRYYRVYVFNRTSATRATVTEVQFYTEEGLTDNATAMSYIGLNNYASNTLLANDTWCKAILLSDYVESVMNVKMPPVNMTGASTPAGNGTVYGSSIGTSSGSPYYYPWKAFDGVISELSGWENSPSDTIPVYLGYKLPSAKCLKGMTFINARNYGAKDFTVQGSNDSSESTGFTDIKSFEIAEITSKQAFPFGTNTTDYSNIRLYFTSLYNSPTNKYAHATEIKFYGRADI